MKVIIAGSRSITDYAAVTQAIARSGFQITEVVSGGAGGVDQLGEFYAKQHDLSVMRFPAEWDKHGKRAGVIRNRQMAEYAEALVAVWDGTSRGTQHMIEETARRGLPVSVYIVEEDYDV